jgi:hypothetical protein
MPCPGSAHPSVSVRASPAASSASNAGKRLAHAAAGQYSCATYLALLTLFIKPHNSQVFCFAPPLSTIFAPVRPEPFNLLCSRIRLLLKLCVSAKVCRNLPECMSIDKVTDTSSHRQKTVTTTGMAANMHFTLSTSKP